MQDLLRNIARYRNAIVFWLLQALAMTLMVMGNPHPRSSYVSGANLLVAEQNAAVANVTDYFALAGQNDQLMAENARLRSELAVLAARHDSIRRPDSTDLVPHYIAAHVVSIKRQGGHRYLTIDRGRKDSISEGMGVRSADGVVGTVSTVGEDFSLVVPILHTDAAISAMLRPSGYCCNLGWNGMSERTAQLHEVATHVVLNEGDTVVTSGLTPAFPAGIPIGRVSRCVCRPSDNYYTIDVDLAVDFRSLRFVQVISNPAYEPISLLNDGIH